MVRKLCTIGRRRVVDKVPKLVATGGVTTNAKWWLEITAVRRCLACGHEEIRRRVSTPWDGDTDIRSVESLRRSVQEDMDKFQIALKGNQQNDETLQGLCGLIRETYQEIWLDWFGSTEHVNNSTLLVWNSTGSSGYHNDFDTIEITIQDGTPDEYGAFSPETWPSWKCELVHEMLHEFENKTLFAPSQAGIELFQNSAKTFPNHPKDDTHFFTAIVDKAAFFQLKPEQLLRYI